MPTGRVAASRVPPGFTFLKAGGTMPALHFTSRIVMPDPFILRSQGAPKRFCVRSLQRSLSKALIVAGLLVVWIASPAQANGIYWASPYTNPGTIGRANLDGREPELHHRRRFPAGRRGRRG